MKKFKQSIVSIVIGLALAAGISWAAATKTPPGDNVAAPININTPPQTKLDRLTVSGFTNDSDTVLNGNVSVGTVAVNKKLDVQGILEVKGSVSSTIIVSGGNVVTGAASYTTRAFNIGGTLKVEGGSINVDYLVVGGGGGGGSYGGGGAGGFRTGTMTLTAGSYLVAIGGGGVGGKTGVNGVDSSFNGIVSKGGGGGGKWNENGSGGGSGGGGGGKDGGSATSGQGQNGGKGARWSDNYGGGGGGGSVSVGANGNKSAGGKGGTGVPNPFITGAYLAGGGGGGAFYGGTVGAGGLGGGGHGGDGKSTIATSGVANTGGGGGGGGDNTGEVKNGSEKVGGNGGSGIVIVRYLTTALTVSPTSAIVTDGSGNVAIGKSATTAGVKLDVGGNIKTGSLTSVGLITTPSLTSTGLITTPNLTVSGTLKILAGADADKILVSDANGVGTWQTKSDLCK